ncbi:MAG: NAD(P)/FAD-dependent oxidoreductase [Candidatus Thorarchaeota archaeon]|nr:NAD(P)/FAD-dependent oxidoreductase [Candidatus Thorarchaeota archaeon]
MSGKSMIIIGAGIAGLATGCYAQMNGYRSVIFEHHSKAGGLAAAWRRKDYLIDGGIHFLIGHRNGSAINRVYRELGTAEPDTLTDMTSYMRVVDETGDKCIDLTSDLDRLERDLIAAAPEDAKEIQLLLKQVRWMTNAPFLTDLGMSGVPPELRTRFGSLKEMWEMRGLLKFLIGKYAESTREFARRLRSPFLRMVLESIFGPEAPVWFVIMILASVAAGQLGLLKCGCQGFIEPIVRRYEALGGRIIYRSTVTRVIVENDSAVGVTLADGTEHRADIVVSAADGYSTIFQLLGGKYVDDRTVNRYERWRRYDPIVMVSLGVDRQFVSTPPFIVFCMKDPMVIGDRSCRFLPLRLLNYSDEFAPTCKTVIQVMFETDWDHWKKLREDQTGYDGEKARLARETIARLEEVYPGISAQVDMVDVATPFTTWRYTLNDRGSPMGWLMTRESLMTQIPRTLPGLNCFYMAGQWVLPGGGVPACAFTGRNVIQILCRREGKPFVTSM